MKKRTLEAVEDAVAQKLEAAGFWRRASVRWLEVMGDCEYTDAQREWVLLRREYCLAQILPPPPPDKLDISEVARAADAALRTMNIVTSSGELSGRSVSVY
ncbi:PerC family transcriptional regulator [Escherichia coli]|uniref:PerC family transcriptional regulator n=2 Tax=Escherichia coli TaxID=562 RepID=UPI0013138C46|nr:PerC family transcriptional regulator [Escherichia coli]MBA8401749.1 PerC family transcriptional regulator [Escherichia coli]MWO33941.1 PerC family transcriptional regulator [Escherichia coli]MWP60175.1 PerC family transcriptional regulator [Escherichia coli]MXF54719.1 PerC family transcriptional regulator [Escherichia coli]MXF73975.1 PerC family transcriptional regulator [Escherichia coli]